MWSQQDHDFYDLIVLLQPSDPGVISARSETRAAQSAVGVRQKRQGSLLGLSEHSIHAWMQFEAETLVAACAEPGAPKLVVAEDPEEALAAIVHALKLPSPHLEAVNRSRLLAAASALTADVLAPGDHLILLDGDGTLTPADTTRPYCRELGIPWGRIKACFSSPDYGSFGDFQRLGLLLGLAAAAADQAYGPNPQRVAPRSAMGLSLHQPQLCTPELMREQLPPVSSLMGSDSSSFEATGASAAAAAAAEATAREADTAGPALLGGSTAAVEVAAQEVQLDAPWLEFLLSLPHSCPSRMQGQLAQGRARLHVVLLTAGRQEVWQRVLERHGLDSRVLLLAACDDFVVDRDGKAAVTELLHSRLLVEGRGAAGWGAAGGGGGDHTGVLPLLDHGGVHAPAGGKPQLLCIADSLVDMPMLQLGCVEPIVVPRRPEAVQYITALPAHHGGEGASHRANLSLGGPLPRS